VVDMAIDGFVYLLLSDGTVLKFGGGEAQPFPQEGLYPPLENPTGIFAAPDATSVFVADASEGRIVEFTREGQFVRQFHAALDGEDHLGAMTAFAVDVAHSRLFVSTASGLYSASLPSLQQ
jgi:DNA-binding beta-propeller fold protein YncE